MVRDRSHTSDAVSAWLDNAISRHEARRRVWEEKYAIRACYGGWFERIRPFIVDGAALEVGGGAGNFHDFWPELITTDIVEIPYLDLVADGMRLPLAPGCLGNLLVIDLLHHLDDPHEFFHQAARILKPGGRILIIEPYITPLSYLCYRLAHHEDLLFDNYQKSSDNSDPWRGNLAMMNILFDRQSRLWSRRHPSLRIIKKQLFSILDFQLAGGFRQYAMVGRPKLYDLCLKLDRAFDWLGPLCAFRIFCVMENNP